MSNPTPMTEQLIQGFTEQYMEKVFYFCLKKTGKSEEAEDLTQDIALNVIAALNRGTIPESFSAWVWKIARNRYAMWADRKHRNGESRTLDEVEEYEIPDDAESALDGMIRREQLAILRRELAFIRGDYRSILVAYYIEEKRVRDIADTLNLSCDTVKQRLHRAREILKEGMNMAREFGIRSYKPEDVSFSSSGPQPSGLPWSVVQRNIPKNILLQASNNPSTAEELSMELGIALPYMEEEIELLLRATLLEKTEDGKYITNFFILDKEGHQEIYNILLRASKERSQMIAEFIEDHLADIRKLGIATDHMNDQFIKWWLVPRTVDHFLTHLDEDMSTYNPPVRANGEEWGFVGYEKTELPENLFMGQNGNTSETAELIFYKYSGYGMWDQCGDTYNNSVPTFIRELLESKRNIASLTKQEQKIWEEINGRYVHADENGDVIPDILVVSAAVNKRIFEMLKNHKNYQPLMESYRDTADKIREYLRRYSHAVLHKSLNFVLYMEMFKTRMKAVRDLVENGFLAVPEDTTKSTLGMYLYLK